jgi:hypothetical protein
MRGLFEFLSIFDWITPSVGFIEDFINDPSLINNWTFFVPYDQSLKSGWNAVDIENLLNQYGVKTWGGQITNGEFFFCVSLEQAQWAEYLLIRYGVPLNERYVGAPPPKKKTKKSSKYIHPKPDRDIISSINNFLKETFE